MPQAYYEDQQHLRYVGSFKRQFSEQEARSLRQRTRLKPGATEPECVCLVCLDDCGSAAKSGTVVGTLDAEPPACSGSAARQHVPEDAAFVLNVVVDRRHRRQGVGRALMHAAGQLAAQQWGCSRMCAHVSAQNEAALALYRSCGFEEADGADAVTAGLSKGSLLGKEYLLVAQL